MRHRERGNEGYDEFEFEMPKVTKVRAAKCMVCGEPHDLDSETFYTISGNVYIGRTGGIIGNNFCLPKRSREEWDITELKHAIEVEALMQKVILCRKEECVLRAFDLRDEEGKAKVDEAPSLKRRKQDAMLVTLLEGE